MVLLGVRFTRLQYARLVSLRCQVPQRFARKRWKTPKGVKEPSEKAMQLGAMLCAGLHFEVHKIKQTDEPECNRYERMSTILVNDCGRNNS